MKRSTIEFVFKDSNDLFIVWTNFGTDWQFLRLGGIIELLIKHEKLFTTTNWPRTAPGKNPKGARKEDRYFWRGRKAHNSNAIYIIISPKQGSDPCLVPSLQIAQISCFTPCCKNYWKSILIGHGFYIA